MPKYVDGFVIVIPKKKMADYAKIAKKAGKIWIEHGALEYRECVGEDMKVSFGLPFPKLTKTKPTEVVVFSWILYKSRKHRDAVMKKVMKDKRLAEMMTPKAMPFDTKRMIFGGFKSFIDL